MTYFESYYKSIFIKIDLYDIVLCLGIYILQMPGIVADSPVALTNGLSVPITSIFNDNTLILGWSDKHNGVISSDHSICESMQMAYCVELILQDGRKIRCGKATQFLTSDNEWVKAKDLVGDHSYRLKVGLNPPLANYDKEIKACNGWKLEMKGLTLTTHTLKGYLETLAFARLLGYILTDGSIYLDKKKGYIYSSVVMGNEFDAEEFVNDVKLVIGIRPNYKLHNNVYYIYLPKPFVDAMVSLEGLTIGRRSIQKGTWPAFILDPNCPTPVIREFLGGLFGGDGHTCCLSQRSDNGQLTSVAFSQSKTKSHLDSLTEMLKQMQSLLGKFGITKTSINNSRKVAEKKSKEDQLIENEEEPKEPMEKPNKLVLRLKSLGSNPLIIDSKEDHFSITLYILIADLLIFAKEIGFRYCVHKQHRLEAGISYRRFRDNVMRQDRWITDRTAEITNYYERLRLYPKNPIHTNWAIKQATAELEKNEPILHTCSIPTAMMLTNRFRQGTEIHLNSVRFTRLSEYLKDIDAYSFFTHDSDQDDKSEDKSENEIKDKTHGVKYSVDRKTECLPTFNLEVLSCRPIGYLPIWQIKTDQGSYVSNGLIIKGK